MPIFDQNGREVVRILDNHGREIETVYDQNGVIVYTNATTIIGTSPMQFKALGLPLKDYRIYGETLQDGTPSPDMPVDVVGCGARTENLFDKDNGLENYYLKDGVPIKLNFGMYVLTDYIPIVSNTAALSARITKVSGLGSHWAVYDENKTFIRGGIAFDAYRVYNAQKVVDTSGAAFIRVDYALECLTDCMFNLGSTALHYEPYGYKLPVTTTNGTNTVTTPIYVGSEPLHRTGEYADYVDYSSGKIMRRIKKLVLTGEETWVEYTSIADCYSLTIRDNPGITGNGICSHYAKAETTLQLTDGTFVSGQNFLYFKDVSTQNLDGWKSYLAAQYTAGTPVTVWYVLSEPIEEDPPISFPELTTLSGTNTLTVDTTIKPSEIDLTGRIKTSGYGQLLDVNDVAIQDKNSTPIFIRG